MKEVSVNADTSTETIDLAIEEEVVEQVLVDAARTHFMEQLTNTFFFYFSLTNF